MFEMASKGRQRMCATFKTVWKSVPRRWTGISKRRRFVLFGCFHIVIVLTQNMRLIVRKAKTLPRILCVGVWSDVSVLSDTPDERRPHNTARAATLRTLYTGTHSSNVRYGIRT